MKYLLPLLKPTGVITSVKVSIQASPVSTWQHRSVDWTDRQTQCLRSRHLGWCSHKTSHWSPLHWTCHILLKQRGHLLFRLQQQFSLYLEWVLIFQTIWPKAMPGSELAVCSNSLPWLRITQRGSDCVVPLGSNKTTWNFLKSVDPMSWFSGQGSSASGILSLSKSSKHASPLPSPEIEMNKDIEWNTVTIYYFCQEGDKKDWTRSCVNVLKKSCMKRWD